MIIMIDIVFKVEAFGLAAHFDNPYLRRIIDINGSFGKDADGIHESVFLPPAFVIQADFARVDQSFAGHQSFYQRLAGHFQAEHGHAGIMFHRCIAGDIKRQAGLAHAGPPGQ